MSAEQRFRAGESGGQFVRQLRVDRGLSPEALAAAVEVSRGTVDRWEKDLTTVQKSRRPKLANALGVSLSDLAAGLGLPEPANEPATKVVRLHTVGEPQSEPGQEAAAGGSVERTRHTPDQRRFLDAALTALETDRACDPVWLAAATATAQAIDLLDWKPPPVPPGPIWED